MSKAILFTAFLVIAARVAGPSAVQAADVPSGAAPTTREAVQPRSFGRIARTDPRFDKLVPADARIEKLAGGFTWVEGPVWRSGATAGSPGCLLFSEIPKNAIHECSLTGGVKEFLCPAGYTGTDTRGGEVGTNGLTFDAQGRLVCCEHGDRRVTRIEKDGKKTVLADRFDGKRLNSPNDLTFDSKGNLYFTDPPYGLEKGADDPKKELPFQGVFRISADGQLTLLTKDLSRPNGIALSPDEKTLYVAVSDPKAAVYMAYDLKGDGTITRARVFFDATPWAQDKAHKGLPDGIKTDRDGNLWATGPGGLHVFTPDATHLGTITPEDQPTANCAWGEDGSVLYMTSNHTICRIKTTTKGKVPGRD